MQTTICECGYESVKSRADRKCPGCKNPGKVRRDLKKLRIALLGREGDDQIESEFQCDVCGDVFSGTILSAKRRGCPACKKVESRVRNTIDGIKIKADEYGFEYLGDDAIRSVDLGVFKCKTCGSIHEITLKQLSDECGKCTFTKFDPSKKSVFYTYIYQMNEYRYIGFGKTNRIDLVERALGKIFSVSRIAVLGKNFVECTGEAAEKKESECKERLHLVETGVTGFHAVSIGEIGKFFDIIGQS